MQVAFTTLFNGQKITKVTDWVHVVSAALSRDTGTTKVVVLENNNTNKATPHTMVPAEYIVHGNIGKVATGADACLTMDDGRNTIDYPVSGNAFDVSSGNVDIILRDLVTGRTHCISPRITATSVPELSQILGFLLFRLPTAEILYQVSCDEANREKQSQILNLLQHKGFDMQLVHTVLDTCLQGTLMRKPLSDLMKTFDNSLSSVVLRDMLLTLVTNMPDTETPEDTVHRFKSLVRGFLLTDNMLAVARPSQMDKDTQDFVQQYFERLQTLIEGSLEASAGKLATDIKFGPTPCCGCPRPAIPETPVPERVLAETPQDLVPDFSRQLSDIANQETVNSIPVWYMGKEHVCRVRYDKLAKGYVCRVRLPDGEQCVSRIETKDNKPLEAGLFRALKVQAGKEVLKAVLKHTRKWATTLPDARKKK